MCCSFTCSRRRSSPAHSDFRIAPWKPPCTASISAFPSPWSRTTRGTRFSAAWSARWSACCPGIGPLAGISILLPVTFGLNATQAIIMLAGIYYGSQYGGSTTSILMRIPGEASSVMTCIDGYAMAQEGPRRRRALHRGGRLVDRRHLRRVGADGGGAAAGDHRHSLRAAGIHRAAGARPDLPRLYVVVVVDPHAADGLPRPAARHDRHRQHDRPFPLQLRPRRTGRRHRHRAGRGRPVRPRRDPVDAERRCRQEHHFAEAARPAADPQGMARSRDADHARHPARLLHRHHPGLGAHHFQLPVLCAGKARVEASRRIRQGRGGRRGRPRNRQQCRLDRRFRADAGARHSDQSDHRGADRAP